VVEGGYVAENQTNKHITSMPQAGAAQWLKGTPFSASNLWLKAFRPTSDCGNVWKGTRPQTGGLNVPFPSL